MPLSHYSTTTGTHFKCAGVTLTGLQALVPLFPSPQIKCYFSQLAEVQSQCVCVCICECMVVFLWGGGRWHAPGTGLLTCLITVNMSSASFCTMNSSDHWFCASWMWILITSGQHKEAVNEVADFLYKDLGEYCMSRWVSAWFDTILFILHDSAVVCSAWGLFRKTQRKGR